MYAIIKKGSKQFRVAINDVIDVDLIEEEVGSHVEFEVLFIGTGSESIIGQPHVPGYAVKGEIIGCVSGPKIESVKYIPGNHRKKIGHRQHYTSVKITQIAETEHAKHAKHTK